MAAAGMRTRAVVLQQLLQRSSNSEVDPIRRMASSQSQPIKDDILGTPELHQVVHRSEVVDPVRGRKNSSSSQSKSVGDVQKDQGGADVSVVQQQMVQRADVDPVRRMIPSQSEGIDVRQDEGAAGGLDAPVLPWAWSDEASRSVAQLVAPKGRRLFLVDTLALVKRLESQGLTTKQSETITAVITEVLNESLENVGQTFASIYEMQRSELMAEAALGKFKGQMQSSQDHYFAMLQQETERLRTDIDKMRNESKYAIDKVNAGQRLDLNLERGRIRDELSTQASETSNLTNKLDREIHTLETQLEAAKFDVIKYCIGTIASVTAVGLGVLRLIM